MLKSNIANFITCIRIACSVAMLFCPVFSVAFNVLYLVAGVSDMVDGFVARKLHTESKLGSALDSVADIVFVAVCLVKILPTLDVPIWVYIAAAVIAAIRINNVVYGYVRQRRFVAMHTVMNKVAGLLLFIFPMTAQTIDIRFSAAIVCLAAAFAAAQEGYYIASGKQFDHTEKK